MEARERALKLCDGDEYAMLHVSQVEAAIEAAEREAREEERKECAATARLHACGRFCGAGEAAARAIEAREEENQGEPPTTEGEQP